MGEPERPDFVDPTRGRLHFNLALSDHQDDSPRVSGAAFDNAGEIDSDFAEQLTQTPSEMRDLEGGFHAD
ncbi:hypothetical protein [Mesorhizobium sp. 2RAF21]|uniref:hypothetical protein n=1 Tax=Mesorhizobium sp. 2RAF21 TaxID=3232995 RepID=UPI003F971F73